MLGMPLQLQDCEVCRIEVLCGITKEEITELIIEILKELGIEFVELENRFETERGIIKIEIHDESCFGLKLYRVRFPDEELVKKFRERLISKRAGG